VVSSTPRPHFTLGKDSVPILQEAGWPPGPVWTGGKSRPHRDSIPDRPARSRSLYRLSYPPPPHTHTHTHAHARYMYILITDCHQCKHSALYTGPRTAISQSKTCIWETLAGCRLSDDPFLRFLEAAACIIIWNQVKSCHFAPVQVCEQTSPVMRYSAFIVLFDIPPWAGMTQSV